MGDYLNNLTKRASMGTVAAVAGLGLLLGGCTAPEMTRRGVSYGLEQEGSSNVISVSYRGAKAQVAEQASNYNNAGAAMEDPEAVAKYGLEGATNKKKNLETISSTIAGGLGVGTNFALIYLLGSEAAKSNSSKSETVKIIDRTMGSGGSNSTTVGDTVKSGIGALK